MMTAELTLLLTRIQVLDNRQVDQLTIEAWADVLPDWLTLEDATTAVNQHFATSTEYLKPAHIVTAAQRARSDRRSLEADDYGFLYTPNACTHVWGVNGFCGNCGSRRPRDVA